MSRASVLAAAMRGELPNVHCYTTGKPGAKKRVASFDSLLGVSAATRKAVGEAIFEGIETDGETGGVGQAASKTTKRGSRSGCKRRRP